MSRLMIVNNYAYDSIMIWLIESFRAHSYHQYQEVHSIWTPKALTMVASIVVHNAWVKDR